MGEWPLARLRLVKWQGKARPSRTSTLAFQSREDQPQLLFHDIGAQIRHKCWILEEAGISDEWEFSSRSETPSNNG